MTSEVTQDNENSANTIVIIGCCTLESSGCMGHADRIGYHLQHQKGQQVFYIHYAQKLTCVERSIKVKSPMQHTSLTPDIIILSGCLNFKGISILASLQQDNFLDLSKWKKFLVFYPPWTFKSNQELLRIHAQFRPNIASQIALDVRMCSLTLYQNDIGIPLSITESERLTLSNKIIPFSTDNLVGLIYFRKLHVGELLNSMFNLSFIDGDLYRYFDSYFSFLCKQRKSATCAVVLPMIKEDRARMESFLLELAKKHEVNLVFYPRISQQQFWSALTEIKANKGLYACDGAVGAMEAICLGLPAFIFTAWKNRQNQTLYILLIRLLDASFKPAAQTLLISNGSTDLSNHSYDDYCATIQNLERLLKDADAKFSEQISGLLQFTKPLDNGMKPIRMNQQISS